MALNPFVNKTAGEVLRFADYDISHPEIAAAMADEWIRVRSRLSDYELAQARAKGLKGFNFDDGSVQVNAAEIGQGELEFWLLDWSFEDGAGRPAPKPSTANGRQFIHDLDPRYATVLKQVVADHARQVKAEARLEVSPKREAAGSPSTPDPDDATAIPAATPSESA